MNAIRHIVSSFIVAIVMCVFAGSAMAFDLGGALKQLQQVVEQQPEQKTEQKQPEKQNTSVQPNQQQNTSANPSANQSTQGQSAQESPSAPKQNTASVGISTEGFCDKVQSTGVYIKFAKLVGDEVRSKTDVKYLTGRGLFDSKDYLLQKWLEDRRRNTFKERTDKKYDRVYKSEFKQCVAKLLPTDFAYVFYTPENVERLRNLSASTETERKVNEKGEVVVKEIDRRHLPEITNVFPSWEAFIFGGENLLSTTGEEYLKDLEVSLKENKEAVIAKNAAADSSSKCNS